jgi:2-polyprenyl-3-methyl-5-hydroxy-6-metoxy-1,4-benzoquinol methylase
MAVNPKELVAKGYDAMAEEYLGRFLASTVRDTWLDRFVSLLPNNANVLDLGCGAGVPTAERLADLGHTVIGIDGSSRQIELARAHVPQALFLHADMTSAELSKSYFDGVSAFYSITHIPADEQTLLLGRICSWLKPGGIFVGSFGTGSAHDWTGDWLGTEMFFSHADEGTIVATARELGMGFAAI